MAPVIKRSELATVASYVLPGNCAGDRGMVCGLTAHRPVLTRYADSVHRKPPACVTSALGKSSELRKLAQALESMRIKLEGKNEIGAHVHALTHEPKSPLAAIRGAAEILRRPPADVGYPLYREYTGAKYANAGRW